MIPSSSRRLTGSGGGKASCRIFLSFRTTAIGRPLSPVFDHASAGPSPPPLRADEGQEVFVNFLHKRSIPAWAAHLQDRRAHRAGDLGPRVRLRESHSRPPALPAEKRPPAALGILVGAL